MFSLGVALFVICLLHCYLIAVNDSAISTVVVFLSTALLLWSQLLLLMLSSLVAPLLVDRPANKLQCEPTSYDDAVEMFLQ